MKNLHTNYIYFLNKEHQLDYFNMVMPFCNMKGFGGRPQDWVIIFVVLRIRGKFNKKPMSNLSYSNKIQYIIYATIFFLFVTTHPFYAIIIPSHGILV
jgi:hypothetical protein